MPRLNPNACLTSQHNFSTSKKALRWGSSASWRHCTNSSANPREGSNFESYKMLRLLESLPPHRFRQFLRLKAYVLITTELISLNVDIWIIACNQ
eukprot:9468469-Pyramimonas_sp.AAC.1